MKQAKILLLVTILVMQFSCVLREIELASNRRLWNNSNIKNYKMTMKIMKTGHAMPSGTFISEVRDGALVSIKSVNEPFFDCEKCGSYDTVEEIFGIIERALRGFPYELKVEFDSKLGYPKLLRLDYEKMTMDDELAIDILQLETLE